MTRNRPHAVHFLILSAVVIAVYGVTLRNGFVWDDTVYTIGNRVYRDFDLKGIFLGLANRVEYLPIRDLSYAADYAVWGERPAGFHLTNLFLFLANVLACYGFVRHLPDAVIGSDPERRVRTAFGAALFLAVHPLVSEPVNFITCRNVLVSGLFFLLSCTLFLRFRSAPTGRDRRPAYLGAMAFFFCALLSKATTIILPLTLLLLVLFEPRSGGRRRWLPLVPFFALAGVFFVIHTRVAAVTKVIRDQAGGSAAETLGTKIAFALQIPLFYMQKLLVPSGLSVEYDVPFARALLSPRTLAALVLLALLASLAVAFRKRFPPFTFAFFWYILSLLPVLNLFATYPVIADRYAYLPAMGVFIAFAWGVAGLPRRPGGVTTAGVVLLWGWLAFSRSLDWRSDITLWAANVRSAPGNAKGYVNLGNRYFAAGDYRRAFEVLSSGATMGARSYFYYYRGLGFLQQGRTRDAIPYFERTVSLDGQHVRALYNLGVAYQELGDYPKAIENYNLALASTALDPDDCRTRARKQLASLQRIQSSQLDGLRRRIAAQPGDLKARGELALKLDELGMYEEALTQYRELVQRGVRQWQVFFNMGNACQNLRLYPEAVRAYEECLRSNPGYADAWFNLATTHLLSGDRERAREYFIQAGRRFPELSSRIAPYLESLR